MTEESKICFLFKKIKNQGLRSAIEAMKAKTTTSQRGAVSYTTADNHLSTEVSELNEYHAVHRHTSAVKRIVPNVIKNSCGTVHTGHHKDWYNLSMDKMKMVNNAQERLKRIERGERTKEPYKEPYHNRYREPHD